MTIRILTSVPDTAVNNGIHHHWIDQVGHVPFEIKPENLENQNMKNQSFILIFIEASYTDPEISLYILQYYIVEVRYYND